VRDVSSNVQSGAAPEPDILESDGIPRSPASFGRRQLLGVAAKGAIGGAGIMAVGGFQPDAARADPVYVDTSTDQTINGVKTFTIAPIVPAAAFPQSSVADLVEDLASKQDVIPLGSVVPSAVVPATETAVNVLFTITPPSRAPFKWVEYGASQADGSYNHAVMMGWNPGPHVPEDGGMAGEPSLYMGFEDGYWDGVHMGSEWYISYYSPDHDSVQLFRPFYCRVKRDNNDQHSSDIFCDIGTDGTGAFVISVGGFVGLLTVVPYQVVFQPPSGNGSFVIDGVMSFLQFRNRGANSFYLQSATPTLFLLSDSAHRAHVVFTAGASALSATTRFSSLVQIEGALVVGAAALSTGATDGFAYLPSCAGPPQGVPIDRAGTTPAVIDSANARLYAYVGGGWRSAQLT
jgi:hypothetical protein